MKAIKLSETEVIETNGVIEFSDGEFVRVKTGAVAGKPRLVISDAMERTRKFVAKARSDFGELSSVLQELQAR